MNTHDKHREIAEKIAGLAYVAPSLAFDFLSRRITTALDEADKDAHERGVRESAEKFTKAWKAMSAMEVDASAYSPLLNAILALLAPPAPVWQHKPDCPTPYQWDEDKKLWCHLGLQSGFLTSSIHALCCDGCGAPKPGTKVE